MRNTAWRQVARSTARARVRPRILAGNQTLLLVTGLALCSRSGVALLNVVASTLKSRETRPRAVPVRVRPSGSRSRMLRATTQRKMPLPHTILLMTQDVDLEDVVRSRIRGLRVARGWSLDDLACHCHLSPKLEPNRDRPQKNCSRSTPPHRVGSGDLARSTVGIGG